MALLDDQIRIRCSTEQKKNAQALAKRLGSTMTEVILELLEYASLKTEMDMRAGIKPNLGIYIGREAAMDVAEIVGSIFNEMGIPDRAKREFNARFAAKTVRDA